MPQKNVFAVNSIHKGQSHLFRKTNKKPELIKWFRINAQINKIRKPQQTGREVWADVIETEIAAIFQPEYHPSALSLLRNSYLSF